MQPNIDVIEGILSLARRAPSADNCQPWQYVVGPDSVRIHTDSERAEHVLNFGDATLLGLGALIASIEVAAARVDLGIRVEQQVATKEPSVLIRFVPGPQAGLPGVEALLDRRTDRRPYRGGAKPNLPANELGVGVSFAKPSLVLAAQLCKCEEILWGLPTAVKNLVAWLRLGSERHHAQDGMRSEDLGAPGADLMFRAYRRWPSAAGRWLLGSAARFNTGMGILSSAGLVGFTARTVEPATLVDVGRTAMMTWLRLTEQGYVCQPMSFAVVPRAAGLAGLTDQAPSAPWLSRAYDSLHKALGQPRGEVVWLLRVGRPLPMDTRTPTPRLPVSAVAGRVGVQEVA